MRYLQHVLLTLLFAVGLTAQATTEVPPPKDVAKPPADAIELEKGISYIVLKPGSGKTTKQYIKSLRTGWTSLDGKTQFNAAEDGFEVTDPDTIRSVTPGIASILKATPLGEKRRYWISAKLMLPGWRDMIQGAYTIDLEVIEQLDPLPAPASLLTPPADVVTLLGGLKYQVLQKGKNHGSGQKPKKTDKVKVHYSGWTADGKMFDSSVLREKPLEFELSRVIKGWRVGLQHMTVGDKFRFWIPHRMAYGKRPRPGAPAGNLVFDVELFEIKEGTPLDEFNPAPYGD